ncbi:unnamed protein product, partial [Gadus morhua 'NCC']
MRALALLLLCVFGSTLVSLTVANRLDRAARVIYEVPHEDSEVDGTSTSSSKGSSSGSLTANSVLSVKYKSCQKQKWSRKAILLDVCLQFQMPPRLSPTSDAIRHVLSKTDKTSKLEVKYINAEKGRGVFATSKFPRGEFVVEYRGDMINDVEAQRRRKVFHPSCTAFFFAFKWRGKFWCIDASREDESLGRLLNDQHKGPNCRMKKIDVDGMPHLCLFAIKDINEGDEITYDYGGDDCPWRSQASTHAKHDPRVDGSHADVPPGPQMDDDSTSNQQASTQAQHDPRVDGSHADVPPGPQVDDYTHDVMSIEQASTQAQHDPRVDGSHADVPPGPQVDDYTHDVMSIEQSSTQAQHDPRVDGSHADVPPGPQVDDYTHDVMSIEQSETKFQNEDEIAVPRLRRTKSIIMINTDFEDLKTFTKDDIKLYETADVEVSEGDSVTLHCGLRAVNPEKYRMNWVKYKGPILQQQTAVRYDGEGCGSAPSPVNNGACGCATLTLPNVTRNHAGRYVCQSTNTPATHAPLSPEMRPDKQWGQRLTMNPSPERRAVHASATRAPLSPEMCPDGRCGQRWNKNQSPRRRAAHASATATSSQQGPLSQKADEPDTLIIGDSTIKDITEAIPPGNVQVSYVSISTVSLTWETLAGEVEGYVVTCFCDSETHGEQTTDSENVTFYDLKPGLKYDFQIKTQLKSGGLSQPALASAHT